MTQKSLTANVVNVLSVHVYLAHVANLLSHNLGILLHSMTLILVRWKQETLRTTIQRTNQLYYEIYSSEYG